MKISSKIKKNRMVILPIGIVFLVLLGLHIFNFVRLNLYTMNESADVLLENSRKIKERARPNYQQEMLAMLPLNQLNGPYYRLDDLRSEAVIREKPENLPEFDSSATVFSFEFNDLSKPGLNFALGHSHGQIQDGILRIDTDMRDYLTNDGDIRIPKEEVGDIIVRARCDKGTQMRLAWSRDSNPDNPWHNKIDTDIISDTSFHVYIIDAKNALKRGLQTNDTIRRLYLIPSNEDGAVVEIDFIRFISKRARYTSQVNGVDYETLNKELRKVLYMLSPQTLEYSLPIPENEPTLDFGIGTLLNDKPIKFEISISSEDGKLKIFSKEIRDASRWRDFRLDLSKWAGKKVALSLEVHGANSNVAFWSNPLISSRPNKRFNVCIILEDALRADHLSTYGYALSTSPVKDSLFSRNGIIFLNAVSQATKTRPSVPTLMTSLLPTATGVWHFSDMLDDNYLTLAEVLRNQGFITGAFLQNGNAGPFAGLHQGFGQILNEETITGETEGIFGDQVFSWLKRNRYRNFFLYLHVRDPHSVYDPPPPYDRWYHQLNNSGETVPYDSTMDPEWEKRPTKEGRIALYDGEIRHNDAQLKEFLRMLESLELTENTLLVFVADHGEYLGEHGLWEHKPPGFLPVIKVPLIFVYPEGFPVSKKIEENVQLIDVMPTILELSRVPLDSFLTQGYSLVDLIEDQNMEFWRDRITVSEEPMTLKKKNPNVSGSIFFKNWHFISSRKFWPIRLPGAFRVRLFDFQEDAANLEWNYSIIPDLYIKYTYHKIISELQSNNMLAWKKFTGGDDNTYKMDPDVLERLRSLGYVR